MKLRACSRKSGRRQRSIGTQRFEDFSLPWLRATTRLQRNFWWEGAPLTPRLYNRLPCKAHAAHAGLCPCLSSSSPHATADCPSQPILRDHEHEISCTKYLCTISSIVHSPYFCTLLLRMCASFQVDDVDLEQLPDAIYHASFCCLAHDRFQEGVVSV